MPLVVGGTDISGAVLYPTARFVSAVNGVAGECAFRYRDDAGTASFTAGDPIVLRINGQVAWRGFVTRIKRVYAFPAEDVSVTTPPRFFDIEGTDLNFLFQRRYTLHKAAPTHTLGTQFPAGTADDLVIAELVANWLDLSSDNLDVSSYVDHVGTPETVLPFRAWGSADTWAEAMRTIAAIPGAIWCIDPDANLVYTDVDTPTAPFGLSDQPDGIATVGYREMEVLADGTSLANDVLAIGFGYGSQTPVYNHLADAGSIAAHGLWQVPSINTGVWKQSSIDRIANSIVYGSPTNHRGHKDDRMSVSCVVRQPGLRAGMKVPFTSNVFGYSDVLPIRRMEITFPEPGDPMYRLTISHEIDPEWSMFDPFQFTIPDLTIPKPRTPTPPTTVTPGGCTDAVCGVTDAFNRTTVAPAMGASDAGIAWDVSSNFTAYCNGNLLVLPADGLGSSVSLPLDNAIAGSVTEHTFDMQMTGGGLTSFRPDSQSRMSLYEFGNAANGLAEIELRRGLASTTGGYGWVIDEWYSFRVYNSITTIKMKVWSRGTAEPASWFLELDHTLSFLNSGATFQASSAGSDKFVDNLAITIDGTLVNRCTEFRFDNFNRTTSNDALGVSDTGATWFANDPSGFSPFRCDGSSLVIRSGHNGGGTAQQSDASVEIPVNTAAGFTMSWTFMVNGLTSGTPRIVWDIVDEASSATLIEVRAFFGTGGSGQFVDLFSNPNYSGVIAQPFGLGTIYNCELVVASGTVELRVWAASGARPGTATATVSLGTGLSLGAQEFLWIKSQPSSSAPDIDLYTDYIDFDYTGKPCYSGGPAPGDGTSAAGAGGFSEGGVAASQSTTDYFVGNCYVVGSTTVWLDGEICVRGASAGLGDYYESAAGAGIITFNTPIDPATQTVQVSYIGCGEARS